MCDLGVCTDTVGLTMMVLELMDYGDLLHFVKLHGWVKTHMSYTCTEFMKASCNLTWPLKFSGQPNFDRLLWITVTSTTLHQMWVTLWAVILSVEYLANENQVNFQLIRTLDVLLQISSALEYLAENGFVHGGVAAENCLGECTVCICTEECMYLSWKTNHGSHFLGQGYQKNLSEQSSFERTGLFFFLWAIPACGIPTLIFSYSFFCGIWYGSMYLCAWAEEYYSLLGLKGCYHQKLDNNLDQALQMNIFLLSYSVPIFHWSVF